MRLRALASGRSTSSSNRGSRSNHGRHVFRRRPSSSSSSSRLCEICSLRVVADTRAFADVQAGSALGLGPLCFRASELGAIVPAGSAGAQAVAQAASAGAGAQAVAQAVAQAAAQAASAGACARQPAAQAASAGACAQAASEVPSLHKQ